MKKKRVCKKQKRVKATNAKTARRVSKHLLMGDQHDSDRAAAEKLRSFPTVPRLKQSPFPREREFGFAGHWIEGKFHIQGDDDFVDMNLACKENAFYLYKDPRGNREDRVRVTGIVETNVAISSGLARELAAVVNGGDILKARSLALTAGKAGMECLAKRTGYSPAYMALHPDSVGTVSFHFGLWPVDPEKRCLIGRSAGGKKGRRGLRLLGDAFMSVLRHDQAIALPADLVHQPLQNLKERDPDDWAIGLTLDRVIRDEISCWPDGENILKRVDDYQRQAALEWLLRFGNAGGYRQNEFKKKLERRKAAAKRLMQEVVGQNEKQIHNLVAVLAPSEEESLLDAAKRIAEQSQKTEENEHQVERSALRVAELEKTLETLQEKSKNIELAARKLEELRTEVASAQKSMGRPATESIAISADCMMERTGHEIYEAGKQVAAAAKRAIDAEQREKTLENEVIPLRKIHDALLNLINLLLKSEALKRLGKKMMAAVYDAATLVGIEIPAELIAERSPKGDQTSNEDHQ